MVDKLRSAASGPVTKEPEESLKKALNANTIQGRIETLHGEAYAVGQKQEKQKEIIDGPENGMDNPALYWQRPSIS